MSSKLIFSGQLYTVTETVDRRFKSIFDCNDHHGGDDDKEDDGLELESGLFKPWFQM